MLGSTDSGLSADTGFVMPGSAGTGRGLTEGRSPSFSSLGTTLPFGSVFKYYHATRTEAHNLRRRRSTYRPQSSSASRLTAGALGFLTFTQCGDRPDR